MRTETPGTIGRARMLAGVARLGSALMGSLLSSAIVSVALLWSATIVGAQAPLPPADAQRPPPAAPTSRPAQAPPALTTPSGSPPAPGTQSAQFYQWRDEAGVEYYTADRERVPRRYRGNVRTITAPRAREAPAEIAEGSGLDAATATGSVPLGREAIVATGHVNGVPIRLLVDTGAARTVITPTVLEQSGIEVIGGRNVQLVGITGVAPAVEVVVPVVVLAGASLGAVRVVAFDAVVPGADGLLGRDLLEYFGLAASTPGAPPRLVPR